MALNKKQHKTIKDLGWNIEIENYSNNEKSYYLSKYSPLGEDFGFNVSYDNPINDIKEYYNVYDAEEHAEMWVAHRGTNGVPNSIKLLLKDAEDIEDMLYELVKKLEEE